MKIANALHELSVKTPLVRLNRMNSAKLADVVVKLEWMSPTGSVKDRIGAAMIEAAESEGKIVPNKTVLIEATSGNAGIALASAAATKGYRLVVTMPESASIDRRILLLAYGAEIHLTPADQGLRGAVARAEELGRDLADGFVLRQFHNPSNPESHFAKTGPEIWSDTDGNVDILVCGVGTGGTISGISRYIKQKKPSFRAIAVEPAGRDPLDKHSAAIHDIQGIGVNFIPGVMRRELVDEFIAVTTSEAISTARRLAIEEGILGGPSSGAAVHTALTLAQRPENAGKMIVAVLPDCGERYLSTILHEPLRRKAAALSVTSSKQQPLRRIDTGKP